MVVVNPLEAFRRLGHSPRHVLWITGRAPATNRRTPPPTAAFFSPTAGMNGKFGPYPGRAPTPANSPSPFTRRCTARRRRRTAKRRSVSSATPTRRGTPCWTGSLPPALHPTVVGNYFFRRSLWWRHPFAVRPAVPNEAMAGIYARHRVSLNIHAQVIRTGTNMRTFECAGYRIAQVVDARAGVEAAFTPEREILTYIDPDDMVRQIRRLLQDPDRARSMARRARRRALDRHTYYHRVLTMLDGVIDPERLRAAAARVGLAPESAT